MWRSRGRTSDLEMPPKENDRLTPEQIALVKNWIDAGAPWPGEAEQKKVREAEWAVESNEDGVIVKTSGGLADEWTYRRYKPEDVWAFRPVNRTPDCRRCEGAAESPVRIASISRQARLDKASVAPAPQADPRTLIRRATFDLLGLPPTPEEIAGIPRRVEERRARKPGAI